MSVRSMRRDDYELIIAALERAIAVLEARRSRLAVDQELYDRLRQLKAVVDEARAKSGDSPPGR